MNKLEKKFYEYLSKFNIVQHYKKVIAKDLAEIAKDWILDIAKKGNKQLKQLQKENTELKKKLKKYEIVNIANVIICKERDKLQKENTELKKALEFCRKITKENVKALKELSKDTNHFIKKS